MREACEKLREWFVGNGGDTGLVCPAQLAHGNGLVATTQVMKNDLVLSVPYALLITPAKVKQWFPFLAKHKPPVSADDQLAVFLAIHRIAPAAIPAEAAEVFKQYLDLLPSSYTTWEYWTDGELALIDEVPSLHEMIREYRERKETVWSRLEQMIRTEAALQTMELSHEVLRSAVKWAVATVATRSCYIPSQNTCLVPFGDLFNYSSVQECTDCGFNKETQAFEFYANRDYRQGDELTICYGNYGNWKLLELYGFATENNPVEGVELALELPPKVAKLLKENDFDGEWVLSPDDPSFTLHVAARMLIAHRYVEESDLQRVFERLAMGEDLPKKDWEVKASKYLRKEAKRLLKKYSACLGKTEFASNSHKRTEHESHLLCALLQDRSCLQQFLKNFTAGGASEHCDDD
eukprot:ANDGO_06233.mRNA.1 Protein SET DOMAIN GROUP 40